MKGLARLHFATGDVKATAGEEEKVLGDIFRLKRMISNALQRCLQWAETYRVQDCEIPLKLSILLLDLRFALLLVVEG